MSDCAKKRVAQAMWRDLVLTNVLAWHSPIDALAMVSQYGMLIRNEILSPGGRALKQALPMRRSQLIIPMRIFALFWKRILYNVVPHIIKVKKVKATEEGCVIHDDATASPSTHVRLVAAIFEKSTAEDVLGKTTISNFAIGETPYCIYVSHNVPLILSYDLSKNTCTIEYMLRSWCMVKRIEKDGSESIVPVWDQPIDEDVSYEVTYKPSEPEYLNQLFDAKEVVEIQRRIDFYVEVKREENFYDNQEMVLNDYNKRQAEGQVVCDLEEKDSPDDNNWPFCNRKVEEIDEKEEEIIPDDQELDGKYWQTVPEESKRVRKRPRKFMEETQSNNKRHRK